MSFRDVGWMRPTLTLVLYGLGVLLRFAPELRRRDRSRLRTDDLSRLRHRWRHRTGDMLFVWAAWVVVQMAVGLPESWLSAFWAPLVIVVALTLLYPARVAVTPDRLRPRVAADRSFPARGGWLVVLAREALPLGIILTAILVVRGWTPGLPEEVPVGWTLDPGPYLTLPRDQALPLLRHQTMVAYLILSGLEGVYLVVGWTRGRRGDIASRMLTVPHWRYYGFKLAWVVLFAGLNLGFVAEAGRRDPVILYLLPGLLLFLVLALTTGRPEGESRESP